MDLLIPVQVGAKLAAAGPGSSATFEPAPRYTFDSYGGLASVPAQAPMAASAPATASAPMASSGRRLK